jgi:hypothetical protein
MSTPRRRLIRPAGAPAAPPQHAARLQKLRQRLAEEQTVLARWLPRLRRAFRTVEKGLAAVARLQRQIARLEEE